VISIAGLCKTFTHNSRKETVLRNLDFQIDSSEIVTILGRSGSGKSVFLDLVMGLTAPSAGRLNRRKGLTMGYVFQRPTLLPWRTVLKNIALPLEVDHLPKVDRQRMAQQALEHVGLWYARDRYPYQLSGGMAQRVAIARALVQDPDMLLMDEPFSALDPLLRENLNINLLGLWSRTRKTILFVTHSINEAVILSDRIVILEQGQFIDSFTIDIPRPRGFETFATPQYAEYVREIRQQLPSQPNIPQE